MTPETRTQANHNLAKLKLGLLRPPPDTPDPVTLDSTGASASKANPVIRTVNRDEE